MAKDKEDAPVEEEVAAEEVQEEAGTEASADAPQAATPACCCPRLMIQTQVALREFLPSNRIA